MKMKKIFFLLFFVINLLYGENLNYITAIKYKDFPKKNFVRLVLFFVSPPPFFEIKKLSERKLKIILYNTDLTKYVPIVKVKSEILSEIIPKQNNANVEVTFIFKKDIYDYSYIKSVVPNLIYLKVIVHKQKKIPLESENKTKEKKITKKETLKKLQKKVAPKQAKKVKPKIKPKPKPRKVEIPEVKISQAKKIYDLGLYKMAEGKYSEAISIFNQILSQFSKDNPYYIKAQFRIADCYYKTMDLKDPHSVMNVAKIYFELVSKYPKNPESSWGMFQIGNCYMKLGFYEEALAAFKYVIKYAPKTLYVKTAKFNVGTILLKFRKYNEAIKYFQDIIKNYPKSLILEKAYYKLGDCYAALKKYKKAIKYYQYAEKNWPQLLNNMPETLYNIGDTYFHLKKYGKAREYFLKIRSLFPKTNYVNIALLKVGETYLKENKIDNALYVFNRVIQISKDKNNQIIARIRMAEIGFKYNISPEIKKEYGYLVNPEKGFLYIIKNYPENKLTQVAYSKLVKYYLKNGIYSKAVYYLEEFFRKFPFSEIADLMKSNLKQALKGYINLLFQNKNYYKIAVYYEKYKEDLFNTIYNQNLFLQIALSLKNLFLIQESTTLFKKIYKKTKKNKDFIEYNIIDNDFILEDKNILNKINIFLKKYPNSLYKNDLLFLKGKIIAKSGNFYESLKIYLKLLNSNYKPFLVTYEIAKLYESIGDLKNAYKQYSMLISFPYSDNNVNFIISDIYFKKGYLDFKLKNYDSAIKELGQFIKRFPNDNRVAEAYFYIGQCYFLKGDYKKAKEKFNFIIKSYTKTFWAKSSSYYLQKINWIEKQEKEFNF